MTTGISTFLIAVGAILYFAVTKTVSGINLSTVGVILMFVGAGGLVISLFTLATERSRSSRTTVVSAAPPIQSRTTTVVREDPAR
jgi:hypothetical protein